MFSASLNQFGTPSLEWSKSEIFIPLFLLGTLFVIFGVFMERDGLPERIVAWGWTILIWGLAMEMFASIGQLAIDGEIGNRQRSEIVTLEGVSSAQQSTISKQQSTIVGLDKALLNEQRITSRERMALNWLVRAVAPRDVSENGSALVEALKDKGLGNINIAYVDKIEPESLATQMKSIFLAAGIMGKLFKLPSGTAAYGSEMYAPTPNGTRAGEIMWDVTRISPTKIDGRGATGFRKSGWESFPEGENTLVIGENDAVFQRMDAQDGEGIDQNGRPLPP
jgi:hypothetical protein